MHLKGKNGSENMKYRREKKKKKLAMHVRFCVP
jgi:hypothetical protein